MRLTSIALLFGIVGPIAVQLGAQDNNTTPASAQCAGESSAPVATVSVPDNPFQALPSKDGCWIYVSLTRANGGKPSIALLSRAGTSMKLRTILEIDGNATGMTVTHDGKMLIVAAGQRILFVDADKLVSDPRRAILGYLDEPGRARQLGRIYANTTSDDKTLFVADENAMTITVIDLVRARSNGFKRSAIIGQIPTGRLPIALTFSPDESLLYATSQWAPADYKWPIECKREGANANPNDTTSVNPQGAIHVIDVARAKKDPAHSIVTSIPAGCSAVRLVISPSGDRAYVTARNSNALLAFDTRKFQSDPAHALIGRVPVGTAPVGVAVIDGGNRLLVTNSNRFAGSADDKQFLTVVDATKIEAGAGAIVGSIAAGAFPREMRVTPDGKTLILTNFLSKSIQAIDLTHLPMEPPRR
jgi:DNA-binding beta-propeller fold protein YncE